MRWVTLLLGLALVGPGSVATFGGDVDFEAEPAGQEQFGLDVVETEQCGPNCGAVTAELTNRRSLAARNVTVHARVYAGQTTDDDARLWSDVERVGFLGGEESVTLTRQVRWGVRDADAVRDVDRWITVEVVVTADDARVTFTGEERL